MGLEAIAELVRDGQTTAVKALLESHALILRAPVKKTLAIAGITDPHVVDDRLMFQHGGEAYALALPPGQADKWLKKLTTAPPSLAQKLGIDAAHPALVHGHSDDHALTLACNGNTTGDPAKATTGIAIADSPHDLATAIEALVQALPSLPLWVIYPKGAGTPLPESAVRRHMQALSYVDTKACAVSARLTASRFSPRK